MCLLNTSVYLKQRKQNFTHANTILAGETCFVAGVAVDVVDVPADGFNKFFLMDTAPVKSRPTAFAFKKKEKERRETLQKRFNYRLFFSALSMYHHVLGKSFEGSQHEKFFLQIECAARERSKKNTNNKQQFHKKKRIFVYLT